VATYISKVTSAGQITIPKKVRETLRLSDNDFVEFSEIGGAVMIQKLKARRDKVRKIRARIKRSGLTKERVEAIVEETREELWRNRRR